MIELVLVFVGSQKGRGVGYAAWDMDRCEDHHGKGNCEWNAWMIYPKCTKLFGDGWSPRGCCICENDNLKGPLTVEREMYWIDKCPSSHPEKIGGLCYRNCLEGYDRYALECEGSCPDLKSGEKGSISNDGFFCTHWTPAYSRAGINYDPEAGPLRGVVPDRCPDSHPVMIGALCYEKCKDGYVPATSKEDGEEDYSLPSITCIKPCSKEKSIEGKEFVRRSQALGTAFCDVPRPRYTRGFNVKSQLDKCPSSHPDKVAALCYKKCPEGFIPASEERISDSALTCVKPCMEGFNRTSAALGTAFCDKNQGNYVRWGSKSALDTCPSGTEKSGLLCYPKCKKGFYGVGPVCYGTCADENGLYSREKEQDGWDGPGIFGDRGVRHNDTGTQCERSSYEAGAGYSGFLSSYSKTLKSDIQDKDYRLNCEDPKNYNQPFAIANENLTGAELVAKLLENGFDLSSCSSKKSELKKSYDDLYD